MSKPKNTTLHCRCTQEDMDAWVNEAYRVARAKQWPPDQQQRPFTRWVTETLNAAIQGKNGAK